MRFKSLDFDSFGMKSALALSGQQYENIHDNWKMIEACTEIMDKGITKRDKDF